jgi:hypothetical protein
VARYILGGTVLLALIAATVTLAALGRPLTDLLLLVTVIVAPLLGALGIQIKEQTNVIKEQTNGNTSELLALIRHQSEQAVEAREKEATAREKDKAELLAMVADLTSKLHHSLPPPPDAPVSPPAPPYRNAA